MALTLVDFREAVRDNIQRPSEGFSDDTVDLCLDWAVEEIANSYTFKEMRRVFYRYTTTGQKRYGFPERMKEIISLVLKNNSNSRSLTYLKPMSFDKLIPCPESEATGIPTGFVDYGTNFELFPIPDASTYTLILRCGIFPGALTGDDRTFDLQRKDALIVAVATKIAFYRLREVEDAEFWANGEAKRLFDEAIKMDKSDKNWQPRMRSFTFSHSSFKDYRNPLVGF